MQSCKQGHNFMTVEWSGSQGRIHLCINNSWNIIRIKLSSHLFIHLHFALYKKKYWDEKELSGNYFTYHKALFFEYSLPAHVTMFPKPRCVEKNIWTVAKYHTCNANTKRYDVVTVFRRSQFASWPGDWLSWLSFMMVFFRLPKIILR
jgi:hypothetical protein